MSIKNLRALGWLFLLGYALVYYGHIIYSEDPDGPMRSVINLTGTTVALALIWLGRHHWRSGGQYDRRTWTFFLLGIAFLLLGDITWFGMEHLLGVEVGIPSPGDIFFMTAYLFLLMALFWYVKSKKTRDMRSVVFDVAISLSVMVTIIVKYGNMPVPSEEEMTLLARLVNLFYPLVDALYLVGLLTLVFISNRVRAFLKEVTFISLGFLCFFVADQSFLFIANDHSLANAFMDPLWPIGRVFLAMAALYASLPEQIQQAAGGETSRFWHYIQMGLPYIGTMGVIMAISLSYLLKDPIFFSANVIVILIIARQLNVLVGNRRLINDLKVLNRTIRENQEKLANQNMQLVQLHAQKTMEANTDFLTSLKNRRYINEQLESPGIDSAGRVHRGLMLIDVDHFKPINDTYGHQVGDEVLCLVADAIRDEVREADIPGRFGGDEFIVILPGADEQTLRQIAARLLQRIASATLPQEGMRLGLSIGATAWVSTAADYDKDELIAQADKALYQAKEAGRNCYRLA